MDKKVLNGFMNDLVVEIAETHGLSEAEARTFVGVAMRKERENLLNCVQIPSLQLSNSVPAETETA